MGMMGNPASVAFALFCYENSEILKDNKRVMSLMRVVLLDYLNTVILHRFAHVLLRFLMLLHMSMSSCHFFTAVSHFATEVKVVFLADSGGCERPGGAPGGG